MKFTSRNIQIVPFALVLLAFVILHFVLDFNGLYGQDSHEYFRYAKQLKAYWQNGSPVDEFRWPKLYPALGAALSYSGISVLAALQFVSLAAMLGAMRFVQKTIQVLHQRDGSLFLILGAATQVYFVRSGFLVMSDALCLFFITGMLYHYLALLKRNSKIHFAGIVVFSLLAFFTRYASIPLLILPLVHGCWLITSTWKLGWRFASLTLGVSAAVTLVFANNILGEKVLQIAHEWNFRNLFLRSIAHPDHVETNTVPNGLYALSNFGHLGYLSFGLLLSPWYKNLKDSNRILLFSTLLYLLFLAGLASQNQRFLVISHPWVLVLLFPAFVAFESWLKTKKMRLLFVFGAVALNTAFFAYSFQKTYALHRLEKEVVTALSELDEKAPVYAFYVDQSFASYDVPNEVRNLWLKRYNVFDHGALVVFNPTKFAKGWERSNVDFNWKQLNSHYKLHIERRLSDNWIIYRIE